MTTREMTDSDLREELQRYVSQKIWCARQQDVQDELQRRAAIRWRNEQTSAGADRYYED